MSERRRAREAQQAEQAEQAAEPEDGETVVLDRAPLADGRTLADDRTVVVDREPAASDATIRSELDQMDEETVLVEQAGAHPLIEDDTVVADRGGWLPEGTLRIGGSAPAQGFSGPLAGLSEATAPRNRFAPPAVSRRAVLGTGAGATSRYTTRRVVAPAPPGDPLVQGVDATRDPAASLPSVRRRARRGAIVSLVTAGAALVVTAGGLAIVIPLLLAG